MVDEVKGDEKGQQPAQQQQEGKGPAENQDPNAQQQQQEGDPQQKGNEEEKPQEPERKEIQDQPVKYSEDTAEQMREFITNVGYDAGEVQAFLFEHGRLPDDVVNALKEKHGEAISNMIVSQINDQKTAYEQKIEKQDKALFTQIEEEFKGITEQSGEETWKELKEWAGKNLADEKDELNAMLAAGGLQAKSAIEYLVGKFKSSDDYVQPAILETGDGLDDSFKAEALSKEGYNEELDKLLDKGFSYESVEVQRLQRRRMKSMQRGM